MSNQFNRRTIIKHSSIAIGVLGASPSALAGPCLLTPPQTSGPYYPEQPSSTWEDADLTSNSGAPGFAKGTPMLLFGRVFSGDSCTPLAGAIVEIWQADDKGRYKHSGDDQSIPLDPAFQYFGKALTDSNGVYQFKTIVPGKYPGRTRHIHFRVVTPKREQLVTQLYFANFHNENLKDGIYVNLKNRGLSERVTTKLERKAPLRNLASAQFDIAVSGKRKVPSL